jgi:glycosyltransferase involved in cell wall biosynthesis
MSCTGGVLSPRAAARRLSLRRLVAGPAEPPPPAAFTPTRILVVDVERPVPAVEAGRTPTGLAYATAEVLVRLHARPLGMLTVDLTGGAVPAARLRETIHARWGDEIGWHLGSEHRALPLPGQDPCALRDVPQPGVSVVVPTCRRPDDLSRCIDSILDTGYPRLQVIVVDNAPADPRTAALIAGRYADNDRVRYVPEPAPGASRARNTGVRCADGEIVAFCDDDIVVDRHWLAALIAALDAHPEVSCVTGLVLPAALDTPVQQRFEWYGGFNRGYRPRVFDLAGHRGDTRLYPYTAGSFGGLGNAAFRRSALRRPDPFDVTLGPGGPAFGAEDQDAFVALLRSGGRLLYEPAALVRHRHREDHADLRWQVFTYGAGFTAVLVHWALRDRAVALELLRRVPAVVPMAFGLRRSPPEPAEAAGPARSRVTGPAAPPAFSDADACMRGLRRLELLGYLYGPIAYGRAVLWRRRLARAGSGHREGSSGTGPPPPSIGPRRDAARRPERVDR